MIGVEVPTWPIRHEICSSEPLKPFLRPMVSELSSGLYCSQSMRGEIVGGVTVPGHGSTYSMGSTLEFVATYARRLVRLMPSSATSRSCQWAGPYDQSTATRSSASRPARRASTSPAASSATAS